MRAPYKPSPTELTDGIRHLVYEYGQLVFAGIHTFTAPGKPIDNLVQDAFLVCCRKLYEFFSAPVSLPDLKAIHYCTKLQMPVVSLPTCDTWKDAIDYQIAHLSYKRVTKPRHWTGYDGTNAALLNEFQTTFRAFLTSLDEIHKPDFDRWLDDRRKVLGVPLP